MKRKFISACLLVLALAMSLSTAVLAFDDSRLGSITVTLLEPDKKTPITGVELSLYYVASTRMGNDGKILYVYTEEFEDCGVALDDKSLTAALESYAVEHAVAMQKTVTDSEGTIVFSDLPLGLYFVKQTNEVSGYSPCNSFLVRVPNEDRNGLVYNVNASPKTEMAKLTDITIKKVWNTDDSTKISNQVTIHLFRDELFLQAVTLNEANHWQTVLRDMPVTDSYSITEVNVPKGFTATYAQNGYVFTVINSASLIQTGQLIWPIPVLALAGLMLIGVGTVLLRRSRGHNG